MKKFAAIVCVAVAVATPTQAQAGCNGHRVAYGHAGHISYNSPVTRVVYSSSVIRTAAPMAQPKKIVKKPVVTTQKTQEVLVVKKKTLVEIPTNSVVTARVRFAGAERGEITLKAGKMELKCTIVEWSSNSVTFQIPQVRMPEDAEVTLTVFRANGVVAKRTEALLLAAPDFRVEPATATLSHAPLPQSPIAGIR